MNPPVDLLRFFIESDNFLITSHISPDPDAVGSSVALSMMLKAGGKKAILLNKDPVPLEYHFIPRVNDFISLKEYEDSAFKPENLVLVDCNSMKRAGIENLNNEYLGFKKTAVIDHHETDKPSSGIAWIVPEAPATGMMVYYIIKEMGVKITQEMATSIYAAISFDTGNFRYENTTSDVFAVASDLTALGAKPDLIYSSIYEKWNTNRFKLMIEVMSSLELHDGIAVGVITKEMFERTSTSENDAESFVAMPRILEPVQVSVLIRQTKEDYYRVSLRSKSGIDMAGIAKAFGGGGHKNAAGFRTKIDIDTLKKALIDKIKVFTI